VLGWSAEEVASHIDGIGETLARVFDAARAQGISSEHAAHDLAEARLRSGGLVG
jgi:hypothetical protein